MARENVENLSKDKSENLELIRDIPNPCMNSPIDPMYERTIPVWSAANPNCSIAITVVREYKNNSTQIKYYK